LERGGSISPDQKKSRLRFSRKKTHPEPALRKSRACVRGRLCPGKVVVRRIFRDHIVRSQGEGNRVDDLRRTPGPAVEKDEIKTSGKRNLSKGGKRARTRGEARGSNRRRGERTKKPGKGPLRKNSVGNYPLKRVLRASESPERTRLLSARFDYERHEENTLVSLQGEKKNQAQQKRGERR